MRRGIVSTYRRVLCRRSRPWPVEELRRSAVVVSPHFDDETLGCGGTIVRKCRAGAEVAIIFMTDGGTSHGDLMHEDELRRIRAAEGRAAGAALGLRDHDIYLLGFQELRLREFEAAATERLEQILRERSPQEVYIPYQGEPLLWSEDHLVTTRAAKAALSRWGGAVTVYEYPIWFYRQWPWTSWAGSRWEKKVLLKYAVSSPLGLGVFWGLPCCHDVRDALQQKRAALAQHRSQMEPLRPGGKWMTLADVAGGAFLECLVQEYELFRRYPANGPDQSSEAA